MAKERQSQKNIKKAPVKSLKEKRAEKDAKRNDKSATSKILK